MLRSPGTGRYARPERERRWLVGSPPETLAGPSSSIVDRYLTGTTLRLRRVERSGSVVFKLTQKVRLDPADPERSRITNTYLTEAEFDLLSTLPHRVVTKTRWQAEHQGRMFAIDVFEGVHHGLVLTEIELDDEDDDSPIGPPPWATVEITHDDRYTGGALARQ